MNSLSLLFVCGSLALLFSAHYAEGFQCYKCAGATSVCSEDDTTPGTLTTCGTNVMSCIKTVITTDTATTVTRDCAAAGIDSEECAHATLQGTTTEACVCNEDSCNGSTGLHVSFIFLAVAMVAVAIFNRL